MPNHSSRADVWISPHPLFFSSPSSNGPNEPLSTEMNRRLALKIYKKYARIPLSSAGGMNGLPSLLGGEG